MERDFYAILGVNWKAEPVEIRTAHRALMRIYHPDADRSEEAAERAREISEAYSVLSNPDRRAAYDESLVKHRRIRFEPVQPAAVARPPWSCLAAAAIGIAVTAAAMIAFVISPSRSGLSNSDTMSIGQRRSSAVPVDVRGSETKGDRPVSLCGHGLAPELLKQELFRLAQEQGAGDRALLSQAQPLVAARIGYPHEKDDSGGCGGWLSLDFPPGLAVDGSRTTLTAELNFSLSRNDEGVLQLSKLGGAKSITRSLATLALEGPKPGNEIQQTAPGPDEPSAALEAK